MRRPITRRPLRRNTETAPEDLGLTTSQYCHEYTEAEEALTQFLSENEDFMMELRRLVEERNSKLVRAQNEVKNELRHSTDNTINYGIIGAHKKTTRSWDATKLETLLDEKFIPLVLKEEVTLVVDNETLDRLILRKEIDRKDIEEAYQEKVSVSLNSGGPKEYTVI